MDEQGIFANNELSLRYIEVYGFDYDYTLASYSDALHDLIYDLAVDVLINHYGVSLQHPTPLTHPYLPIFAKIRILDEI